MNTHTFKNGTWRRLVHQRERIVVRDAPTPPTVSQRLVPGASGSTSQAGEPHDTRGYERAEAILDRVAELRAKREKPVELRYDPASLEKGFDAWLYVNSAWLEQQVSDEAA